MSGDQERRDRISWLFEGAIEREGDEREQFLQDACGNEDELLQVVKKLLSEYARSKELGVGTPALREDRDAIQDLVDRAIEGTSCEASPTGEALSAPSAKLLGRLAERAPTKSRYTLKGEVARGGMGAILKVWDKDLRRTLAMKVILGNVESSEQGSTPSVAARTLGRFLEEAQVTGQLDHPGIVPVHELGVDEESQVYFTMRLVKGQTLAEIFELAKEGEQGWTQTRVLGVLLKVCEAMSYAHSKGVIHRDLKPANIMVGRFGEVYVMDWGVAKAVGKEDTHDLRIKGGGTTGTLKTELKDQREQDPGTPLLTMDGTVVGTPAYMPPEQARGEVDKLDGRSDVYAIGAMLYHLLTGNMPYVTPGVRVSAHAVWRWVIETSPRAVHELSEGVPSDLEAICEKAMARDKDSRYPSMLDLADDILAYLENRVVRAHRSGALVELQKWIVRNRTTAIVGAVAILALAVGFSWALVERGRANQEATEAQRALQSEKLAVAEQARLTRVVAILMKAKQERQDEIEPVRAGLDGMIDPLLPPDVLPPAFKIGLEGAAPPSMPTAVELASGAKGIPPAVSAGARFGRVPPEVVLIEARTLIRDRVSGEILHLEDPALGIGPNFDRIGEPLVLSSVKGAGFCASPMGWILTNSRLVEPLKEDQLLLAGGEADVEQSIELDVIFPGSDVRHPVLFRRTAGDRIDIALLKIRPFEGTGDLTSLDIDLAPPGVGSVVHVFGFNAGSDTLDTAFSGSVTRSSSGSLLVDIDSPFRSIGGPVTDSDGRLIGLISSAEVQADSPVFASAPVSVTPIADARSLWPPPSDW